MGIAGTGGHPAIRKRKSACRSMGGLSGFFEVAVCRRRVGKRWGPLNIVHVHVVIDVVIHRPRDIFGDKGAKCGE